MIETINFGKAYDSLVAVTGMSFRVEAGQVLGMVGPNGAGKTTTMRALAGILPSSHGQLRIADFDVDKQPLKVKQRVAYVPDDPQLFHDLTVEQHLAFTASIYGVDQPTSKITHWLETFDLAIKRKTRAADLSRGMRQKLAICCAYLHDPQALLLDEPMTGLDPHGIRVLKQSIGDKAKNGAAVIISSHLLAMVEDICTHVLIMNQGRQHFFGTIDQLRSTFAESTQVTLEDIFFEAIENSSITIGQPAASAAATLDHG